jgi:hypothetical protein
MRYVLERAMDATTRPALRPLLSPFSPRRRVRCPGPAYVRVLLPNFWLSIPHSDLTLIGFCALPCCPPSRFRFRYAYLVPATMPRGSSVGFWSRPLVRGTKEGKATRDGMGRGQCLFLS